MLRAGLETTQVLAPDGLDATYTFSLKSLHQGVRDLVFECDPALRPYDVDRAGPGPMGRRGAGAEGRRGPADRPPPGAAGRGDRSHPLRRPSRRPRRTVRPCRLDSPGIRLLQSVNSGETLVLKVHPDLRLADAEAGGVPPQGARDARRPPDGRTEFSG